MLNGWLTLPLQKAKYWGEPQASWMRDAVKRAGIHQMDWFRRTQDRKGWRKTVKEAFPTYETDEPWKRALNAWKPGRALPRNATGWKGMEKEGRNSGPAEPAGVWECPVCSARFTKGNQLKFHYDAEHSVRNPDVATSLVKRCPDCKQFFARKEQLKQHVCPVKQRDAERLNMQLGGWLPVRHGPPLPPPRGWHIAIDGSGKTEGPQKRAGWGIVIFRAPIESLTPDYILHAPVVTQAWEPTWIGARECTNNTGELSAIGETMIWLLEEAPDAGDIPVEIRYDSNYAANVAQGRWTPSSNEELAIRVQDLTKRVSERRRITWTHVYGHTGVHDNEMADQAADLGMKEKCRTSE